MTDRFVPARGARNLVLAKVRMHSRTRRPPGCVAAPSTSRISVSAPRALSSMRSSAAGVSSALGSRAAPEACTTSAPIRWTSSCTTPASSRLRSSSRAASTCAARCSARTAESRRSSRTCVAARGHQGTAQRRSADEQREEEEVVGNGVRTRVGHLAGQGQEAGVHGRPEGSQDRSEPCAGRETLQQRRPEPSRVCPSERGSGHEVEERPAGGQQQQRDRCRRPSSESHLGHGTRVGRARITVHHSREGRQPVLRRPDPDVMNSTRLALGATLATTFFWTAKAVAIGSAGGLNRSPLESPLFLLGLACCLVASAATGVAVARRPTMWGRTLSAAGGIVVGALVAVAGERSGWLLWHRLRPVGSGARSTCGRWPSSCWQ